MKAILGVIDGWVEPTLTWNLLIRRIASVLHIVYTRQALHRYPEIARAFSLRKEGFTVAPPQRPATGELRTAIERIERLEAENRRLGEQNDALLERFVTWAYNASLVGLDERKLDQAIPPAARS